MDEISSLLDLLLCPPRCWIDTKMSSWLLATSDDSLESVVVTAVPGRYFRRGGFGNPPKTPDLRELLIDCEEVRTRRVALVGVRVSPTLRPRPCHRRAPSRRPCARARAPAARPHGLPPPWACRSRCEPPHGSAQRCRSRRRRSRNRRASSCPGARRRPVEHTVRA